MKFLLFDICSANLVDWHGTALCIVIQKSISEELLGSCKRTDVNAKDEEQYTKLHVAGT